MQTINELWIAGKELVASWPGVALILSSITVVRWAINLVGFVLGF